MYRYYYVKENMFFSLRKALHSFLAILRATLVVVLYVKFTAGRFNKVSVSISSVNVCRFSSFWIACICLISSSNSVSVIFFSSENCTSIWPYQCWDAGLSFCLKWQLLHSKYAAAVDCSSFFLHLKQEKYELMEVIPNISPSMVVIHIVWCLELVAQLRFQ